ncbi:MAG TPA: epoxyqueuosine reductase QueH [Gammaproteobacteria bacterium]|nr:epoxyqueuosine reductase QueH [Gammaproteobacteria bacterium]
MNPATNSDRPSLPLPDGEQCVLLHSCCAPCAADIMSEMKRSGVDYTILFYNPNIHPKHEYELRKSENKRYAEKLGVPFVDLDYDTDNWFARIKGLEYEPERGERCTQCFDMRFERSALYAVEYGFKVFTSSLGISRWKDMDQINRCGERAAARHENLSYWTFNWRKGGGSARTVEISKIEHFYQQEYCGCIYSLRDTNLHRKTQGKPKIKFGIRFYKTEESK